MVWLLGFGLGWNAEMILVVRAGVRVRVKGREMVDSGV